MAIKITKPGQKEFHGFCKWCGCEFTYEISDLKLFATGDKLDCPTCGKTYYHSSMVQDPTIPGGIGRLQAWPPEPIPCTPDMTKTDPCAGCAWRENLLRDGLYIGDTPCTWCNKNRFNTISSAQPSIEDYATPCVNKLDTHLTRECSCDENAVCSKCSGTLGTTTTLLNFDVNEPVGKVTCMCEGDIWTTCGCCSDSLDSNATKTAVEAAQTNCNHIINQVSKSIIDNT